MMLKPYHMEMMHLALDDKFSPQALEQIIGASVNQDRLRGQIGHDEYHFDNNAFEKSYAYMEEQRALTVSSLMANDTPSAWSAFGRLTHTAQDFYAHSNYIDLWLACQPDGALPTPSEVDPLDPDLIHTRALRSGKVYLLELLTFIPILKPLVIPSLPRDAHGWMNLDSPERGPNFKYAFQAAVKRTKIEFEITTKNLPHDLFVLFVDK
ncbi:MAG TPA: hypothetical protein VMN99_04430 [Anaerolineales bacterium]|nr:hypothetical protein [Anaerolineales bacterium]